MMNVDIFSVCVIVQYRPPIIKGERDKNRTEIRGFTCCVKKPQTHFKCIFIVSMPPKKWSETFNKRKVRESIFTLQRVRHTALHTNSVIHRCCKRTQKVDCDYKYGPTHVSTHTHSAYNHFTTLCPIHSLQRNVISTLTLTVIRRGELWLG